MPQQPKLEYFCDYELLIYFEGHILIKEVANPSVDCVLSCEDWDSLPLHQQEGWLAAAAQSFLQEKIQAGWKKK